MNSGEQIYTDLRGGRHTVDIPVEKPWGRQETLEEVGTYLPNGFHVLEFGTARKPKGMTGDGWSTLFWCVLAMKLNGSVWSIDNDPDSIHFSKWLTKQYRDLGRVVHLEMDGRIFVEWVGTEIDIPTFFPSWYPSGLDVLGKDNRIKKEYRVDLVYLDGPDEKEFDYDVLTGLWARGVYPHYILLDDVHKGRLQKGEKIIPYLDMEKDVKQIFFCNGQALYEYTGEKHRD